MKIVYREDQIQKLESKIVWEETLPLQTQAIESVTYMYVYRYRIWTTGYKCGEQNSLTPFSMKTIDIGKEVTQESPDSRIKLV